jgi:hypothetical protein
MEVFSKRNHLLFAAAALVCWLTIALQLYLNLLSTKHPLLETRIRFFSYFTILTNGIVALCFTALAMPAGKFSFFKKPSTLAASAAYITVVGVVYNLILRYQWNPQGINKVVDQLLHTIIPLGFVLFWLFGVAKDKLEWKLIGQWLLYPAIYLVYTVIRGYFSDYYPYPFINAVELGYATAFLNAFYVLVAFVVFFSIVIGIGKVSRKRSSVN